MICVFMDPIRILVWNVRGLNSSSRQDVIRTLVNASRADIVCLQETKMAVVPQGVLLSMLGTDFSSHVELPSTGASGGIIVAWRRALGTTGQYRVDTFNVSVQFCVDEGQPWWATCVYGLQGSEKKILFIQELRDIRAQCQGPSMIAEDFNLICKVEDKNNTNYNRVMMGRFRRLIDDLALKDVPLHGRKYTWSTQQASPTLVRLDRVLRTGDWEEIYPNVLLQSATTFDSDHYPLLLELKDNKVGKRRFHFEAFWPKLEGFHEAVEQVWQSIQSRACPLLNLHLKFWAVEKGLQAWSEKKVGHVESQLALAREVLHQLEIAPDGRILIHGETVLKNMLKSRL
jgi:exonuclease III